MSCRQLLATRSLDASSLCSSRPARPTMQFWKWREILKRDSFFLPNSKPPVGVSEDIAVNRQLEKGFVSPSYCVQRSTSMNRQDLPRGRQVPSRTLFDGNFRSSQRSSCPTTSTLIDGRSLACSLRCARKRERSI